MHQVVPDVQGHKYDGCITTVSLRKKERKGSKNCFMSEYQRVVCVFVGFLYWGCRCFVSCFFHSDDHTRLVVFFCLILFCPPWTRRISMSNVVF